MSLCPLCTGAEFDAFRFGLLRCAGCGLVVDPAIFRQGEAERINEGAFSDGYEPQRSFWVRWFEAWKNRRYLANLRRAGVTGGKLLEIGVGTGSFLRAARDAGFEVEGCDLSVSLARRVTQATGIRIHTEPLDRLPKGAYDVVVMHHVLEHVSDPVGFLRAACERVKPGGILHIAVPNVNCWQALLPGWNSYEPYHMLYFDRSTLTRTAQHAQLMVMRMWTFDPFSIWFLSFLRTVRRTQSGSVSRGGGARASAPGGAVEHAYRIGMILTGTITWPLRWIQARLGRGDELLLIAKRHDD